MKKNLNIFEIIEPPEKRKTRNFNLYFKGVHIGKIEVPDRCMELLYEMVAIINVFPFSPELRIESPKENSESCILNNEEPQTEK